jgi:hypothetical protein
MKQERQSANALEALNRFAPCAPLGKDGRLIPRMALLTMLFSSRVDACQNVTIILVRSYGQESGL